MSSIRCRLGMHSWVVRWKHQVTPLWASQYLLAIAGNQCAVFCERCGETQ